MPRTVYHPESGAFEIFPTEDELAMENLRRENARLKEMLEQANFQMDRISRALESNGIPVGDDQTADLESMDKEEVKTIARRLGIDSRGSKETLIEKITSQADPYDIWKASR